MRQRTGTVTAAQAASRGPNGPGRLHSGAGLTQS